MDDKQKLKRMRGTFRLLEDIGVFDECPRLKKAITDEIQEITQRMETPPPKGIEGGLQLLLENGWCVQIQGVNDVRSYAAEAGRGVVSLTAKGRALSDVLGSLAKKVLPYNR